MIPTGQDSLQTRSTLEVGGKTYAYYSLPKSAEALGDISRLPFSMKVLLENLLRFEDGKEGALQLPSWLEQRAAGRFAVIRNGRGYASWNPAMCGGMDAVEVLSASGKSCGCMQVPEVTKGPSTIGRDGSLIVPHQPFNAPCEYWLYPQLFK